MTPTLRAIYPQLDQRGPIRQFASFVRWMARQLSSPDEPRRRRMYLLFDAPVLIRRICWLFFVTPWRGRKELPIPPEMNAQLAILRRDGIVRLERNYAALADHILKAYFAPSHVLPQDDVQRTYGMTLHHSLTFRDPLLQELLFDPDLCALMYNYYGRQPYYRDNPTVLKDEYVAGSKMVGSGIYHSDGYRQISFMLLLNDLTPSDTHMQYAIGSHVQQQPSYDRQLIAQEAVEASYPIFDATGPKGTLYVFDTEGLHRGLYRADSVRQIFHQNVTTGSIPFTDPQYDSITDILPRAADLPPHVAGMISRAVRELS